MGASRQSISLEQEVDGMNRRFLLGMIYALLLALLAGGGIILLGGMVHAGEEREQPAISLALQPDTEQGILVARVLQDSAAARSGVVRGDILLEIDGQEVNSARDLHQLLAGYDAGATVEMTVQHGDEVRSLTVTLGEEETPLLGLVPCRDLIGAYSHSSITPGATIHEIIPGGPAEQAGLQVGDVIVTVDGQALTGDQSLAELINQRSPGDMITLEIERTGEENQEVQVQLGSHPEDESRPYLGIRYTALHRTIVLEGAPLLTLPHLEPGELPRMGAIPGELVEQGLVVMEVADGSPAAVAGVQRQDIITAIDGEAVSDPGALARAVAAREPGESVRLTIQRAGGEPFDMDITLAEHPDEEGAAYLGVQVGYTIRIERIEGGELLPGAEGLPELIPFLELHEGPGFKFDLPPHHFEHEELLDDAGQQL
jgi:S1-C subfamily serine protease